MLIIKPMLYLVAMLACLGAKAQGTLSLYGFPPFATPGSTTTWSVYACPDSAECPVPVTVTVISGVCSFKVPDLVDRNPNQKKQELVWLLTSANPGAYDVNFLDPGIDMTYGGGDVTDVKKDKKEHRKKIKQQTSLLLTYDIVVEYKTTAGTTLPCSRFGPGIINRG